MNAEDAGQEARVESYVERFFQRSGQTTFPTVRQVARALRMRLAEVAEVAEMYDNLMLTSYNTTSPQPLAEHFVETLNEPLAALSPTLEDR